MSFRVYGIEESSVARDLIDKGIAQGMAQSLARERRFVLNLGRTKLGPPSQDVLAAFEAIDDLDGLEALGLRLFSASTWEELLAEPPAQG